MPELWRLSALQLKEKMGAREVKPSEVTESILARIDQINPQINAFCTVDHESARAAAQKADEAMAQGKSGGALFGVPLSIKDLILTKELRTTFGSRIYENFIPDQDEIVVERLRAAGAIILGKTNTSEFGFKAVTDCPLWGVTRNPWNPEMTPAGSSGGAAAAVASGLGPLAVGSDAGGSIRAPASYCGIFGFKPSLGRIPIYPLLAGWETLDRRLAHLGPLTRTVADAALMMEVMAGRDARDPVSLPGRKISWGEKLKKGVKGLKIAWSAGFGKTVLEPEVRDAVEGAAGVFQELGGEVEMAHPEFPSLHDAFQTLFAAECAGALADDLAKWREKLDPGLVRLAQIGLERSALDYVRSANQCHDFQGRMISFFQRYDLLLTPVLPLPPFPVGIDWPREIGGQKVHPLNYLGFTYPFDLTGQPAASVPCAWNPEGLPLGLQIIGRYLDDVTVLRAAAAFEEARPWQDRWPLI